VGAASVESGTGHQRVNFSSVSLIPHLKEEQCGGRACCTTLALPRSRDKEG
jgi:hypothetical protein